MTNSVKKYGLFTKTAWKKLGKKKRKEIDMWSNSDSAVDRMKFDDLWFKKGGR